MNVAKLQSDRKRIKAIDARAARQSSWLSLLYLPLFAYIALVASLFQSQFKWALILLFGLLITTGLRFYLLLKFSSLYAISPQRWRQFFFLLNATHTLWLSAAIFTGVYRLGSSSYSLCLLFWMCGLSLVQLSIWVAYRQVNQLQQTLLLMPAILACVLTPTPVNFMVAVTLLIFYGVALHKLKNNYQNYWNDLLQAAILKESQHNLELAEIRALRFGDSRQDFLADLSHEVRTPMSSMLGMLTLLADTCIDVRQREILQVAQQSGHSLLALMDDILDFASLTAGSVVLNSSVFNLRKCIDDRLEILGPLAHDKSIELSCWYDADVPLRVRGDAVRISQILQNLISILLKLSEAGDIVVKVKMTRLSSQDGLLRIELFDLAESISEQKVVQLTQTFQQINAGMHSNKTNVSLAICKGLVEAMQGQLGFMHEPDQGSYFWFTAQMRLSTQQGRLPSYPELLGKRVLIYGAKEGLVQALRSELNYWGMQVDVVQQGYDLALQALRKQARDGLDYDLMIIDMGHVYQESLKLSKIIAEDPALAGCKQILMNSLEQLGQPDLIRQVEAVNALTLLTKPVKQADLHNALIALFGLKSKTKMPRYAAQALPQEYSHYKILLVEDHQVNQLVQKALLKKLGFSAKVANNGREALALLANENFDLILMDCQMPEMDGYQATLAIRKNEAGSGLRIPIIAMTANAVEGEATRCLAAGMDEVLFKPVDIEHLENKLRYWLLHSKSSKSSANKDVIDKS